MLVDAPTQRLAGSAIGFAEAGTHRMKGKGQPEALRRATRALAGAGGAQRVDGLEAPLIGREAELGTVKALFHAATERRVPRMVVVAAPAGRQVPARLDVRPVRRRPGHPDQPGTGAGACPTARESRSGRLPRWCASGWASEEDARDIAEHKLADGLAAFVPDPGERA